MQQVTQQFAWPRCANNYSVLAGASAKSDARTCHCAKQQKCGGMRKARSPGAPARKGAGVELA